MLSPHFTAKFRHGDNMNHMTPFRPAWQALALALMLSACSNTKIRGPSTDPASCPAPPSIALTLNEAVLYYTCLGSLSAPDIAKEYIAVGQSYSKTGSDADRIKLAMLLSLPDTAFHSTEEALKLLQDSPDKPGTSPSGLHVLAKMLSMLLTEQAHESDISNNLAKELAAEKARSNFLQGKIDAVKNLEINMIHRDQP